MFNTFNNYKTLFTKGIVNNFAGAEIPSGNEELESLNTEELIRQAELGGIDEQELAIISKQFNKDISKAKEDLKEPMKLELKELLLDTVVSGIKEKIKNKQDGLFRELQGEFQPQVLNTSGIDYDGDNLFGSSNYGGLVDEEVISKSMGNMMKRMGISRDEILTKLKGPLEEYVKEEVKKESYKKGVIVNKKTKITQEDDIQSEGGMDEEDRHLFENDMKNNIEFSNNNIQEKVNALLKEDFGKITLSQNNGKIEIKGPNGHSTKFTIPEVVSVKNGVEYNKFGEENLAMLEPAKIRLWAADKLNEWKIMDNNREENGRELLARR